MWTYEDLARLSPDEFEQLVADLWRAMGFNVRLTGGPGDQGVDIIAEMERGVRLTLYIQAKCYGSAKKVDVREIREYSSLLRRGKCDSVVVVCASGFTGPALAEARELGVRTIDGQDLVTLLNQYNVPLPVSRQVAPSLSSTTEEPVHRVEEEESVLQLLREVKKATPDTLELSLDEEAVLALVLLVLGGIGLSGLVA
ncbi:MAG: restriction endonuclease, partial [Candidatus Bipolaricaulota bacterium]|nr:restriction endonuclease [Candidatus Bipolaricaulota bacterium]